jgi:hypothetical protein
MSTKGCLTPLSFEHFVDYWFGDLPNGEQEDLEEHLIACSRCGNNAESWAVDLEALGAGARLVPRAFLTPEQLAAYGSRANVVDVTSQELTLQLGTHPIHVFRVSLDEQLLSGLERLDVEYVKEGYPEPIFYVSSVPLQNESGKFHFACHAHVLGGHGDATMRLLGTRQGQRFTLLESLVRMA